MPKEQWEFDQSVTDVFEDMLQRSIPGYGTMRTAVAALAIGYAKNGTSVIDLGCSKGETLASVRAVHGGRGIEFVGAEISPSMIDASRERFSGASDVTIERVDLRESFPGVNLQASVVASVLTLQFVPINHRQRIVRDAFESLADGGAFILVEKILGSSLGLDQSFVDAYHQMKGANGYTGEEVARKQASLEGVLVPLSATWNESLMAGAGFREVDCFWRWMNFAGWIGVK
jgi:tRNA (cmo5U34)-methyltransferase